MLKNTFLRWILTLKMYFFIYKIEENFAVHTVKELKMVKNTHFPILGFIDEKVTV